MNFDEYQTAAIRTLKKVQGAEDGQLSILGLGLAEETGEAISLLHKYLARNKPLDLTKLEAELGDVLWYVTAIAELCGLSMDHVAKRNVEKLLQRYPDGFKLSK